MTAFEKHTSPMRRGSYEGQRWYKVRRNVPGMVPGSLLLRGRKNMIVLREFQWHWAYVFVGGSSDDVQFFSRRHTARRDAEEFLEALDTAAEVEEQVRLMRWVLGETKQKMADVITETRELVREIRGEATP